MRPAVVSRKGYLRARSQTMSRSPNLPPVSAARHPVGALLGDDEVGVRVAQLQRGTSTPSLRTASRSPLLAPSRRPRLRYSRTCPSGNGVSSRSRTPARHFHAARRLRRPRHLPRLSRLRAARSRSAAPGLRAARCRPLVLLRPATGASAAASAAPSWARPTRSRPTPPRTPCHRSCRWSPPCDAARRASRPRHRRLHDARARHLALAATTPAAPARTLLAASPSRLVCFTPTCRASRVRPPAPAAAPEAARRPAVGTGSSSGHAARGACDTGDDDADGSAGVARGRAAPRPPSPSASPR